MKVEFSFRREESGIFGKVLRPVARITLINGEIKIPQLFYIDSGADITLIPRSVGEILGLEIKDPKEIKEIKGVGERRIPIVIREIKIKIGDKIFDSRIAWSLIEEVPLLLGRLDVFGLFDILFQKERKIIFTD